MTVFVRSEEAGVIRLKNTSGGDVVQHQLVALGGQVVIATEAVASNAIGAFQLLPLGVTVEVAAADLKTSEDTFGTANHAVYFDSVTGKISDTATQGYYLVGLLQSVKTSDGIVFISVEPSAVDLDDAGGAFVMGTGVLTAAAAATPVHVIPDASVPTGKKFYPLGMIMSVGGATAWTDSTATVVKLQDTAGSPVAAVSVAKAQLTGNAVLGFPSTGVTLQTPVRTGAGMTAAKGIDVVGDANFAAGSDISVTHFGVVK